MFASSVAACPSTHYAAWPALPATRCAGFSGKKRLQLQRKTMPASGCSACTKQLTSEAGAQRCCWRRRTLPSLLMASTTTMSGAALCSAVASARRRSFLFILMLQSLGCGFGKPQAAGGASAGRGASRQLHTGGTLLPGRCCRCRGRCFACCHKPRRRRLPSGVHLKEPLPSLTCSAAEVADSHGEYAQGPVTDAPWGQR